MYSYSKMSLTIDLSLLWNYMKIFCDKYLGSLKLLFSELSPKLILQSILCIFKKLSFVAELTFLNEVNFQHNVSWKFGDPLLFVSCENENVKVCKGQVEIFWLLTYLEEMPALIFPLTQQTKPCSKTIINLFQASGFFLCPPKTSEN